MRSKTLSSLPTPVRRTLRKVGSDIADARKRRRISTETMCGRAMISRPTLAKIEKGDPDVSFGKYATVLFIMGMTERLTEIADPSHDLLGMDIESENLPQRIYQRKRQST